MRTSCIAALVAVMLAALALQAGAISITWHAPNAACYLDPGTTSAWGKWEFDNPLKGNEHIMGHPVLQWRDADYNPASPTPYADWIVHPQGGTIDGCSTEIWMRDNTSPNQWIETGTTVASTIVAINLPADSNDGLCEVWVDNQRVFSGDMGSWPPERLIILVKGLPNQTHWIEVRDLGTGATGGCDVHCFGAAALGETMSKFYQPPWNTEMGTIYHGWNEKSYNPGPQAAADDWVCTTNLPVKDIHWWGSYLNWKEHEPPAIQPDYFHITIWTDVPAGQTEPFSHPGQCIWSYDTLAGTTAPVFQGWDYDPISKQIEACFKYNVDLPTGNWFYQSPDPAEGGIYWLCIQAVYQGATVEYPWGWKTLPRDYNSPAPDDAVAMNLSWLPQRYQDYWPGGRELWWDDKSWDLAFELTTTTTDTWTKWMQAPIWESGGQRIYGWDERSRYEPGPGSGKQIVADDWMCTNMDPVSDVHWWGSYLDWVDHTPPSTAPQGFYIGVWTDIPKGTGQFSHPGTMLKQWYVHRTQTNERYIAQDYHPQYGTESCFMYDFDIPPGEWFQQTEPNTIYWLSIAADYGTMPPINLWGWKTRQRQSSSLAPDGAVRITNPTQPDPVVNKNYISGNPIKDAQNNLWDTAFYLTSKKEIPSYKWQQPPAPDDAPKIYGWDEKSVYSSEQIVGDDWLCQTHFPVTDIHWWGSFLGWGSENLPQLPDRWRISIWDDVPVSEKDPFSHPGKCVWDMVVPKDEVSIIFAGWDIDPHSEDIHYPTIAPEACFKFEADLRPEQWFYQPRDSYATYWVTVAAEYDAMPANVFGWKTVPHDDPSFPPPDDAVRIFDPTAPALGIPYVSGEPIILDGWRHWNVAFNLTTIQIGTLTFDYNIDTPNHTWQPGNQNRNNMLSLNVGADFVENISLDSITLQAFGRGNDAADISSIEVWLDTGFAPGRWGLGDTLIGTGTYSADNGLVTIGLWIPPPPLGGAPLLIPAGGLVPLVITYTMNAGATPGESYYFKVVDASGTGQTSGQTIFYRTTASFVVGLPKTSARKVITGLQPITIPAAKQLLPGFPFMLQDKLVTADLTSSMSLFYIEEETISPDGVPLGKGFCGIGVDTTDVATGPFNLGDKVTLYGETTLLNGTELVVMPDLVSFVAGYELPPNGMSNKSIGGGAFGFQPGVSDDGVLRPPAYGLSNVGMLVRSFGMVTGNDTIDIGGGRTAKVWWIDDGSTLLDGFPGAYRGVAVLEPTGWATPANGSYMCVTGIVRAIPNPAAVGVRLLVPRDSSDVQLLYVPP